MKKHDNTLKIVYGAAPNQPQLGITINLRQAVRLMYKSSNTLYLLGFEISGTSLLEQLQDFNPRPLIEHCHWVDGYYYADHYNQRGGYLGTNFKQACDYLVGAGLGHFHSLSTYQGH